VSDDDITGPDADESDPRLVDRESTMLRAAMAADVAGRASQLVLDDEDTPVVLVADDDAVTRNLVANVLRSSGYEVVTASDGQEAVARIARGGIDVALLDAVMPRMSGVDACRTIKGIQGEEVVPVALVFAKTDTRSRIACLEIGADGYVCKPLEETELLLCVSSALRLKRAHERLRAARQRLESVRGEDELTGARSFSYLHERLEREFERAERHAEPLACCLVDVDRLKLTNERGGRTLGDTVLRGVVEVVRGSLRDSDVVARYGGDELFVMLPATHFAGSLVVATRIWRDVAARTFGGTASLPATSVTVSLGVALFPSRDVRTRAALLGALESALREAKRRGGNRLCVFQQEGFLYSPADEARI
jgi:two-component system, cell cycle response regulator